MALDLDTPHGPARAHLHEVDGAAGWLVLGHGAGGGVGAPDIVAATRAANEAGCSVALVEQPYRVAGRRSPAPARQLDAAWLAVCEQLPLEGLPLVAGGRSSGARVACRTAPATGAAGVLCLAFPLRPPQRRTATIPPPSRQDELDGAGVPILVIQGDRDPFGLPEPDLALSREVVVLRGDHGLKADHPRLRAAVGEWLGRVVAATG